MLKNKKQQFRGAVLSYILTAINIFVNFLYVPILLKFIGAAEYGLLQIVASFFSYLTIFETSISAGVLRYYCVAKAKNDVAGMENILACSRNIYHILSVVLIGIGCIVSVIFVVFYRSSLPDEQLTESVFMLAALFVNMVISVLNSVYIASIVANEKFVFYHGLRIIVQLFQPLLCCLIIMRYPYACSVVFVQLFVNIIAAIVRKLYAVRKLHVKLTQCTKDNTLSKEILFFASSLLLANIADQIFWKADQIILGKMYGTVLVAVYSIGGQIYTCYQHIGTAMVSIFYPKMSKLYQENNAMYKMSNLFIQIGRIVFYTLLLVLSGFFIFGKEFISIWVGEKYMDAYYVALLVMVPFTIDLVQNIGLSILQIMNKYSFRAKIYFIAALLNIITTIVMARYMGIIGAALSTGISMFITSGLILNWYYSRLGLQIQRFWRNICGILIKLLPYILIIYYINTFLLNIFSTPIQLIVKIMAYTVGFCVYSYLFTINFEERKLINKLIDKVLAR